MYKSVGLLAAEFALLMISNNEKFNSFVCPGNTAKITKLRDKFQIVINTCVTKDCPLLSHDPFDAENSIMYMSD